jgi:hypothetical protein
MIFCNKDFTGKSTWLLVALLSLFLVACPTDDKNGEEEQEKQEEQNETLLTISNNCSRGFFYLNWNGTSFNYITSGNKRTENADPGTGYIFFSIYLQAFGEESRSARSQELVTLEKGESKTFVFLDSTVVVAEDGKSYTLIDFVNQ